MRDLITTGRTRKPETMLIHGVHGIGKSTFGTKAPNPIYITGEEIEEVDASKFPKCKNWDDFLSYSKFIRDEDHDFKTLVIDTLDSIETLLHNHILKEDGADDMARAMGGYGKAYTLATQLFQNYRDEYLVPIRENKKMVIILLCHSTKNKFEDPLNQTSYDVFEMKLHKSGKGVGVYTVFSEWVSIIGFANFEVYTVKDKTSEKRYAVGDGERVLHCTPKPAYDAKNRYNLPEELPFEYPALMAEIDKFWGANENPELIAIKNEINGLVAKISDETIKNQTIQNLKAVGNDLERLEKAKQYIKGVI